MSKEKIAILLRDKRTASGLSVEEVVRHLSDVGINISSKTLYGYESGVSTPNVNTFVALCDLYKVSDIIGEVTGKAKTSTVFLSAPEWPIDYYNDFFNTKDILEKVFLLMKWGIPSFSGYEDRLAECFPTSSETANFSKLYSAYLKLDEHHQGLLLDQAEHWAKNPENCKDKLFTPTPPTAASVG